MPELDIYFDKIDGYRLARAKELSEIKIKFGAMAAFDAPHLVSKAAVVLSYAHWEGFYNECTDAYIDLLINSSSKVRETSWSMLIGVLTASFESLRASNHSIASKKKFVAELQSKLECNFIDFDKNVVKARSNLDFGKLSHNYEILSLDVNDFQKYRIRIDKELVGWRHSVAHGEVPDLSAFDISNHVDFTSNLILTLSDHFQDGMLRFI